jgi:ribosomal protein S18 acetylase RimI-like enzyme
MMMKLTINVSRDAELLIPLLHDADEDDARTASALADNANTAYAAYSGNECVGAAVMHWQTDESEILYIAVREQDRGKGYGKALIAELLKLAREQSTQAVVVGTANSSLDNISFYQKCGFRMDSIRKDYFSYFARPVYENGILIQDMLMLRYELTDEV